MGLSVYDPDKGCFVLKQWNPKKINAFHKDFVKVHMPNFLDAIRTESMYTQKGKELSKHVDKVRDTKPTHGTLFGMSEKTVSVVPKKMMKGKK